jgi:eukaryotic-like serine/threonine-protein kinase
MIGKTLANYKVVEKLGEGGMGVVYKALDVRLNRFLALKFLNPDRLTDEGRRRFYQEAKASSALNHPSITHIYDIGQSEGAEFIAMEYVEGNTLQKLLQKGPLPVDEALSYAIQVADALSMAHAAGIIHRDLKPANVMVTARGLVKILDFGLAKLKDPTQEAQDPTVSDSGTLTIVDPQTTVAGNIVGSPAHMSPEQALGKPVDARSDIFAFGGLMHQMLTGKRAFSGATTLEVLGAILHVDPPKSSSVNPAVTPELDWIVTRCLRKDPERRFQAMSEVKVALEDLRADPNASGVRTPAFSASSIPTPAAPAKQRNWVVGAGFALGLGIAVVLGLILLSQKRGATTKTTALPEVVRLTTEAGLCIDPAISADGKLLAYSSDRSGEGNMDIWVRQIEGGEPIRLTRDKADDLEPTFSPDGTKIVFRSAREGGGLYMVPTLGGEERKVVDDGRQPQFSPDGTKIAYWTGPAKPYPLRKGNGQIFILDLDKSTTRPLRPDFAAATHPVWSPDGRHILFVGLKDGNNIDTYDWWFTPVEGGQAVMSPVLEFSLNSGFHPFAWRKDKVYFAREDKDRYRIGEVTINPKTWQPVGTPRALTAGTTSEYSPSVSRDGRVVFASITTNPDLYSVPVDVRSGKVTGGLERLTKEMGDDIVGSISANGKKVAFLSNRTGVTEVWGKDLSTGQERALTSGGGPKDLPLITPDGESVAWRENNKNIRQVFLTPFNGGVATQICADCGLPMAWSPDGKFLLHRNPTEPRAWTELLDVSARKAVSSLRDAKMGVVGLSISNDGKWLALAGYRSPRDFTIYAASFAPDRPAAVSEWVEVTKSPQVHPNARWSPDGGLLYFTSERDGYTCVWAQRVDPATKRPLGELFAVQHFHAASLPMATLSAADPVPLGADKIVVSLNERFGGIWMLKLPE